MAFSLPDRFSARNIRKFSKSQTKLWFMLHGSGLGLSDGALPMSGLEGDRS